MSPKFIFMIVGIIGSFYAGLFLLLNLAGSPAPPPLPIATAKVQYLTFQIGTYHASYTLSGDGQPIYHPDIKVETQPFDKRSIKSLVAETIVKRFGGGLRGDGKARQVGFFVGPMSLDHTDEELREIIRGSFEIAEETDVAVGFHIDDSMFWQRRRDLWKNPKNIEWLDWKGTPNTGRQLSWGRELRIAPQMCFNSKEIQAEIIRIARDVIGKEIKTGVDFLKAKNKGHLFAGVIAGWETQIGLDFHTRRRLGYCALANKGFSAERPPQDIDRERETIVAEFIDLWAKGLSDAGIEKAKIYGHVAFVDKNIFERLKAAGFRDTFASFTGFGTPAVAFSGKYYNPGFSLYGIPEQLTHELDRYKPTRWAMAEGTVSAEEGKKLPSWEKYLTGIFNRGATVANIFPMNNDTPEAIAAYRKFLRGETLSDAATR
jgi:hypothetical protein